MLTTADADLESLFAADGPLADCLKGYRPRPEQLAMAKAVAQALTCGDNLVIEAGTGTGKTLAYLLPALDSGQRVIISTGTKTLQDQLFHRDLPMIGQALGRPVDVQLLKGRSNYLCLYRLDRLQESTAQNATGRKSDIGRLRRWAERTVPGDIAECTEVAEDSPLWPRVTSTVDNCLGSRCPVFDDCHVVAARHAAREAEMVVVNHHLLMADLAMKEEGFGQLLPGADAIVVDEAHHFPDVAQSLFTIGLGSGQMFELVNDLRAEAVRAAVFTRDLEDTLDALDKQAADARLTLPGEGSTLPWEEAGDAFAAAWSGLGAALDDVIEAIGTAGDDSPGLQRCRQRAESMYESFESISALNSDQALRWIRIVGETVYRECDPAGYGHRARQSVTGRAFGMDFHVGNPGRRR